VRNRIGSGREALRRHRGIAQKIQAAGKSLISSTMLPIIIIYTIKSIEYL